MNASIRPATKRIFAILIAAALGLSLTLAVVDPPARAAKQNTPTEKVLVVSANVYETENGDSKKLGDMHNFVDRVLKKMRFAPDVLLLQEIAHPGVAAIRKRLSSKTGDKYTVAKDAAPEGESPWKKLSNTRLLGSDNAIVINSTTMKKLGKGGYFKFGYKRSQAKRGSPVKVKRHAYVPLKKKGTDIVLPAVSLHYPKEREFRSSRISKKLKKKWSKQIAEKLNRKYPVKGNVDHMKVIGGDFNNFRCQKGSSGYDCRETPAYHLLTHKPYRYRDSVLSVGNLGNPIDFIFSTNNVCDAGVDHPWSPRAGKPGYYSNHPFRWALLEGKPDTCRPTPLGKIDRPDRFRDSLRIQGWNVSYDGGSGFKEYQIWRKAPSDTDYKIVKRIKDRSQKKWEDHNVTSGVVYSYFVKAVDWAGNESKPTNKVQAEAR